MAGNMDRGGPTAVRASQVSTAWTEAIGDIDALMSTYQNESSAEYTGITKDHWTPTAGRSHCMNPSCNKAFSLKDRHHHCRRCGMVFCKSCTSYRRKLNILAHPDPAGKPYKVCRACFEDPQTLGTVRDLMADYRSAKWSLHQGTPERRNVSRRHRVAIPGIHSRLDAMLQCERLVNGFQESLSSSTLRRAAAGLKGRVLLKKPAWQLHTNNVYERLVPQCRGCSSHFSLLLQRHFCTVCGAATCKSCTAPDLIVYVPNDEDKTVAHWSIIKIVGCPEKEPELCMYLRVCDPCKTRLAEMQAQDVLQESIEVDMNDTWAHIEKVYANISQIQKKIDIQLPKYQELIDGLEITPGSAQSLPQSKSNTQILAKAQGDLSDHFTQLVMTIHGVKSHKPPTKTQTTLMKNLVKSKIQFYQENMFTFRELKRRLEAITPLEVLTVIQDIVDHNAINSCYLSVKQLALEVLHLSIKNELPDDLMLHLTPLEQVVLDDLEVSVRKAGEDLNEHMECVNQLLQLQLKHHRLVLVPSGTAAWQIEHIVGHRMAKVLRKVELQMLAKCADRSFPMAKASLEKACREVSAIYSNVERDTSDLVSFVVVAQNGMTKA